MNKMFQFQSIAIKSYFQFCIIRNNFGGPIDFKAWILFSREDKEIKGSLERSQCEEL